MTVDVYHSGDDRPKAPFLLIKPSVADGPPAGRRLPDHPQAPSGKWLYWKRTPLKLIAVIPSLARQEIDRNGYIVQ
jgi:hypothetical protein